MCQLRLAVPRQEAKVHFVVAMAQIKRLELFANPPSFFRRCEKWLMRTGIGEE